MNLTIEYCLRVTLVFVLAFAVTRMLHRQPAAFRHVVWVCAFGIAGATPLFMRVGPRIQIERTAPAEVVIESSPVVVDSDSIRTMSVLPARAGRRPALLGIVWVAGVLLVGIRMWNAGRKARALLKNAIVLPSLEGIRIAETDDVATAMTLGTFRPWILLPREHRLWEPELLRAVLMHEMAHVRRRDCLMQWLPNLMCAVYWFHPLVWLARSEMLCESERACDDAVIRSGFSGSTFARDLVEIAQSIRLKGDSLMSIGVTTAVTTKLERRISRLLDPAANRRPLTAGRAVFGAALALTLLLPVAGVTAEQTFKAPTVIALPQVTPRRAVVPEFAVDAPKKIPRGITQITQTQIAQAQFGQTSQAAQSPPTGSLSGAVSDPTGAVVMGATVRVQFSQPPVSYSTVTGPAGRWNFSALPAGTYTLEVQVPGFRTFNKAVAVNPGLDAAADVRLSLGRATESVTVTAERPNASVRVQRSVRLQQAEQEVRAWQNTLRQLQQRYRDTYPDVIAAQNELATSERKLDQIAREEGLPSPPPTQAASKPLRVSAGVQPAKLIRNVPPVFPQSARAQGIQGSVTFEAVIDKAGFIKEPALAVGDAPADLVQAARDAIRSWQYSPALLNGEPVEVLTEITVNFTLQ